MVARFSGYETSGGSVARIGFTLIELLVVIAIIGVLLALALPAIGMVRERSRRVKCANNLKQVGLAIQNHEEKWSTLPEDGKNRYGHCVFLLQFLDEKPLYERLNPLGTPLADPTRVRTGSDDVVLPVFLCPSRYADKQLAGSMFGRGDYMGTSNLFAKAMSLSDVRDGESQTFAAGEIKSDHGWVLPGTGTANKGPNSGSYGSEHSAGAHFVFCDGAVRFISNSIDENTFNALATPRSNDKVGEF